MKLVVTSIPEQYICFLCLKLKKLLNFERILNLTIVYFHSHILELVCIYTFRAYEQIYHDLPTLVLEENNPCYFQLYFYDTGNELQNRMRTQYNENLSAKVVEKLMKILKQNLYPQVLRRLEDISFEDFEIHIAANSNLDQ